MLGFKHPRGEALASGQEAGGVAEICIWRLDEPAPAAVLSGAHGGGVAALEFSPDGARLASIGADAERPLIIWDWARGQQLAAESAERARQALVALPDSEYRESLVALIDQLLQRAS